MPGGARRFLSCHWLRFARRVLPALCLWLAGAAQAQQISAALYSDPTTRYAHAVLGDDIEHGSLELTLTNGDTRRFTLPESSVFEDTEPRLADVTGDGSPEVIVVESDQTRGARLAIYDATGRIATTPYIGTRFRWLAPIGSADLDGDGKIEVAYVDRPHLAKTLRIWRFDAGQLTQIAELPGLTNHRIGEPDIAGGIRTCNDAPPEMILATANWTSVVAVRLSAEGLETRKLGPHEGRSSFAAALRC